MTRFRRRQHQEIDAFRSMDLFGAGESAWFHDAPDWFWGAVLDGGLNQHFGIEAYHDRRTIFRAHDEEIVAKPHDWIVHFRDDGMVYPCPARIFNTLFEASMDGHNEPSR